MQVRIKQFKALDIKAITDLHKKSFSPEVNYSVRLGDQFLCSTYRFFIEDRLAFGFIAYIDNVPAGFIVGRLDYYYKQLNRYRAPAALLGMLLKPGILFDKNLTLAAMTMVYNQFLNFHSKPSIEHAPSHKEGKTATLASLGVAPEYLHYRISDHLVNAAEEHCLKQGKLILRTGVLANNVPSRFLFRRRGYQLDKVLSNKKSVFYYLDLQKKYLSNE